MSAAPLAAPRLAARAAGFARFVLRRFMEDRCPQTAAALAYTTLLALVPLVTVTLAVLSAFPVFGELTTALKIFLLTHMVPEIAGRIITVYMVQFSEKAARLTLVGIGFLAVSAILLLQTIEQALNGIWRVNRARPLAQRLLVYWAVLTVGPLLLGASLSITSYLVSLSLGYVRHVPVLGTGLLRPVPVVLTSLAFALLYWMVPNRSVPFRHALTGGVVAGLGFELMKKGFAWYVTSFPTLRLVYGAFAALPIFLLWIYLSWLMVLVGAVLAATLGHWRLELWMRPRAPGWQLAAALGMLGRLAAAQRRGVTAAAASLAADLPVSAEEAEDILERLREAGLIIRAEDGGWALGRAAEDIRVIEVHRLFVRTGGEITGNAQVDALLAGLDRAEEASLGAGLAGLFPEERPAS